MTEKASSRGSTAVPNSDRVELRMAVLSGAVGLLGALIGGGVTWMTARDQVDAQAEQGQSSQFGGNISASMRS